ncbi:hypothetical protein EMIHUDRAFT_458134 [Emiliania huxleyi CCMP1516]|uniref:Uncharacterized protein n=2 Tax=Emiliania huxleyi TaxID=2903 RepID=A0A0D3JG97_EMIH1|nr:hypothetical protein EMIHUDRAFT_458134 [Emiliania huxleyi CCMP1516]EOD22532.1 hypothetical protein EMIHUDRAFT_458134 [Emiliania huxleyi CCMP1516]|eukprot:XP_005774961.1 hypothetical protein EMIHUDRAFT_458134 [Emiliania huxleyi CCMP1516]
MSAAKSSSTSTVVTTRRFTRFDFDMDTSSGGRAEERAPDYSYSISDGLLTFLSVMAPTLVLNLAFSVAGFGDVTYLFLEDLKYPWYAAADACLLLCLLLWMLDAHRWTKSYMVVVRRLCIALAVLLAAVACSLATRVYPFAPLQLGVSTPRRLLQQGRLTPVTVVESVAVAAALSLTYFALWVAVLPPPASRLRTGWDEEWLNLWGGPVKAYWEGRLGCEPFNATASYNDIDCYDAAFCWFFFPLLVGISLVVFAVVCRFLARVLASETNAEADAAAVKLFVGAISVAGLGMCSLVQLVRTVIGVAVQAPSPSPGSACTSPPPSPARGRRSALEYYTSSILWLWLLLTGAGMGLSHIVSVAMLNLVAAALLLVGGTLGWETFARAMAEAAWVQRGLRYIESGYEWCVALVICVGVLPLLAYALLLAGKQATRWLRGSSKASRGGIVTAETHERLTKLSVHWGSVCSKVALLCQGYLCMSVVVAKFVVVFLCWLSAVLAGLPLGLVGIVLFLVPVIPGIPVYVCSGVLLTGAVMSEEELADPTPHAPPSYWLGVALAVSARFVLTQRGCTFGKTVVLCGGPDWPTSVLTGTSDNLGILGLSCPKMLFGSIPVVLLILPSTAMGSALIMANQPLAMTMAMLATQMGASVGFVAVIEHAATAYEAQSIQE